MNFRTFSDLNNTIFSNIHKLPKDISLVAGIPRSGLLAANIIALYLNLPLTDINSLADGKIYSIHNTQRKSGWIENVSQAQKILVVDDSSASGNSIKRAREKLREKNFYDKIIFMAVYAGNASKNFLDTYFELVEFPRMFEWNYLHHSLLRNACFDIDGVLCPDPSEEQNDDGEKYIDFIRNAPARFIPTYEIGYIITSRLEKYRADTEYWLKKNNIRFVKLIMMQFATKEERIKSGSHGKFKAQHYKKIKQADIFIESNAGQAEEIAMLSGKTVFCTDNHCTFPEGRLRTVQRNMRNKFITIKFKILSLIPKKLKSAIKKIILHRN